MRATTKFLVVAAASWSFGTLACGDNGGKPTPASPRNESAEAGAEAGAQAGAEPDAPAAGKQGVKLADEPRIDLLDNRFLWHLSPPGQPRGLIVALASEGLRKYTQEYSQPWGKVLEVEGKSGRALDARSATLHVPWWQKDAALMRVRVHGATRGQRISIDINGKRVANAGLEASWQVAEFAIDAGALHKGENTVQIFMAKRGGPARSYGLFHSIDIVPESAEKAAGEVDSWPALSPVSEVTVGGAARPALGGFERMSMYVEIPAKAWLAFQSGASSANTSFRVTARTVDSGSTVLFEQAGKAGAWQEHSVSLAGFADRLVELTLEAGSSDAAWAAPRIAVQAAPSRQPPKPYENAIMLVIDALRADRLAVYGETPVNTPNITADARKRGVVFRNNQAASPSSPPSHGSIQTGMIPRVHGVTGDKGQLEPGTPMISTQLGDAGIATAYYGNNPFGMARLEKPGRWTAFHQPNREGKGIDCTTLIQEMLQFAAEQSRNKKRFFISSLPYETHTPYRYHEGITDKYHKGPWGPPVGKNVGGDLLGGLSSGKVTLNDTQWAQLKALYNGEAEYMDGCYKMLVDGVADLGLTDSTLIVITSDHGEGMFEHGRMGHAFGHYSELANVPFILIGEGLTNDGMVAVDTVTSHLDITPTIIDLMGVTPSERIQGRSLLPLAMREGPWTPRVMPLEYGRSYALRARRWKYIVDYKGNESLFDLQSDPTEQREIGAEQPMALRYMRDVAGFFLAHRKDWRMATWGALNNHGPGFLEHVGAQ